MASSITPAKIQEMKEHLKKYPVDPQYDGLLDGEIPYEQAMSLLYASVPRRKGELPDEDA